MRRRGPRIETDIEKAYYCSHSDAIYLPTLDQFDSSEDYYAAAFHELTHWTGGAGRLCRDTLRDYHIGTDVRSQEELTAEMGAAFLLPDCRPGHIPDPAKLDGLYWLLDEGFAE